MGTFTARLRAALSRSRRGCVTLLCVTLGLLTLSAPAAAATRYTYCAGVYSTVDPAVGNYVRARTQTAPAVVYGDSITYQMRELLPSSYGFDAQWGRKTAPTVDRMLADVRARGANPPALVIMAVGTNDRPDPSRLPEEIREARSALPPSTRLAWVDVYAPKDPAGTRGVNTQLSQEGVEILSWSRTVQARHAKQPRRRLLDASGVHVSCAGGRVRAQLITSYAPTQPES